MKLRTIHPLLFGIFPVLFLFAHNATEMNASEILQPLGITLLSVIAAMFLLSPLIRNIEKRALVVTIIVVLFFSYGHLLSFLNDIIGTTGKEALDRNWICLIIWLPLLLSLVAWVIRTRRDLSRMTYFLNSAGSILVILQIVTASYTLFTRPEISLEPPLEVSQQENVADRPDIYYIVLDGYGRSDILKQMYSYDNSEFLSDLKDRGFFIADSSNANYCATLQSLGSTLSLNYIQKLGNFNPGTFSRVPLTKLLANNRLTSYLKQHGYATTAFESGHTPTSLDESDNYFVPPSSLSEFDNILLNSTPLPLLFSFEGSQFDLHRERILFIMEQLKLSYQLKSPKFVFAHLISPHPPFVFNSDGSSRKRSWPFSLADGDHFTIQGGTREEYLTGYKEQITYLSRSILEVIDSIKANSLIPPIIIMQGDHGPGSELSWETINKTNIQERFPILNAYHLPGVEDSTIYRSISPVNSFRLVLNNYFGEKLEFLPDRSFYTTRNRPYGFIEVRVQ